MLSVLPEVADALASGAPVVALESTIISHGLPRPDNLRVAREIEQAVRRGGAVPATIALVDGHPCIGLDDAALEQVATRDDVLKVSTRDLATLVARKGMGATTVAATSHLAALAGIGVFATGDQYLVLWPPGRETVRRSTSATSVGDPEDVHDLLDRTR